ncbi:hypothetical protein ACVIW0_001546 [Bradyrhizobium sp. USDA 4454]
MRGTLCNRTPGQNASQVLRSRFRIRTWRLALTASPMSERRAAGSWHGSLSRVLRCRRALIRLAVCHAASRTVLPTGTGDSPHRALRSPADRCRSDFEPRRCADFATEGAQRSEASPRRFGAGCKVCYDRFSLENVAEIHICSLPSLAALYFQAARLLSLSQPRLRPQYRPLAPRGAGAVSGRQKVGRQAACGPRSLPLDHYAVGHCRSMLSNLKTDVETELEENAEASFDVRVQEFPGDLVSSRSAPHCRGGGGMIVTLSMSKAAHVAFSRLCRQSHQTA